MIVYSLLIIVHSLLIIVHSLLIKVYSLLILNILLALTEGKCGLGVEERICISKEVRSILPCACSSFFAQENRRKFPVITENFGTLGSKFPGCIEQSFSRPLTVWSGAIRSGWRNPA
jgi:hypothetical protein